MKTLGYFGAAAIASVLCFSSAPAFAGVEISTAALALIGGAPTGNGGQFVTVAVKKGLWANDSTSVQDSKFQFYWGGPSTPKKKEQNSQGWYDLITSDTYFNEITNIADVEPGQIFAIPPVVAPATPTFGGAALVIVGLPLDITPPTEFYTPYITGTKQYAVKIADSTGSNHGPNGSAFPDSRWVNGVFQANTPGTGYIRFYTDESTGEIIAYTWAVANTSYSESSPTTDSYFLKTERPFAIGEVTSPPAPAP